MDEAEIINITPEILRNWPLPQPNQGGDKNERGSILIVGGAPQMPGAVILAATAALRAGAGKLRVATCSSIAQAVGVAVPESYVLALPETKAGGVDIAAVEMLAEDANKVNALVIGPGMVDEPNMVHLMRKLLPLIKTPALVLDATAFVCLSSNAQSLHDFGGRAIITPHAGEMSYIMDMKKEEVRANQLTVARAASQKLQAVVALKGRETFIAAPYTNQVYRNHYGNVGLATSGSGDTLSGIVGGLVARGAEPQQAASWAVYLHARAGDMLAKRIGHLGYLARELLAEIPALMCELDPKPQV